MENHDKSGITSRRQIVIIHESHDSFIEESDVPSELEED